MVPPLTVQDPTVVMYGNSFFLPRTLVIRNVSYEDRGLVKDPVPFVWTTDGSIQDRRFYAIRPQDDPQEVSDKELLLAQIEDMTPLYDTDRDSVETRWDTLTRYGFDIETEDYSLLHTVLRHIGRAVHHSFCFFLQGTLEDSRPLTLVVTIESHHLNYDCTERGDEDEGYAPYYFFRTSGLGRRLVLIDGDPITDQALEQVTVSFNGFRFRLVTTCLLDGHLTSETTFSAIHLQIPSEWHPLELGLLTRRLVILESRSETTSLYDTLH